MKERLAYYNKRTGIGSYYLDNQRKTFHTVGSSLKHIVSDDNTLPYKGYIYPTLNNYVTYDSDFDEPRLSPYMDHYKNISNALNARRLFNKVSTNGYSYNYWDTTEFITDVPLYRLPIRFEHTLKKFNAPNAHKCILTGKIASYALEHCNFGDNYIVFKPEAGLVFNLKNRPVIFHDLEVSHNCAVLDWRNFFFDEFASVSLSKCKIDNSKRNEILAKSIYLEDVDYTKDYFDIFCEGLTLGSSVANRVYRFGTVDCESLALYTGMVIYINTLRNCPDINISNNAQIIIDNLEITGSNIQNIVVSGDNNASVHYQEVRIKKVTNKTPYDINIKTHNEKIQLYVVNETIEKNKVKVIPHE